MPLPKVKHLAGESSQREALSSQGKLSPVPCAHAGWLSSPEACANQESLEVWIRTLSQPPTSPWKARWGLTYTKSLLQPGQEHPQPEFRLQVSMCPFVQEYVEQFFPLLLHFYHSFLPFASIFSDASNTSVLLWCDVPRPDCSDELPDTLLLLHWEGAKGLSAQLLDSFPVKILSVAGLFEYPGKSSANCRLARHVPRKQFYQNF